MTSSWVRQRAQESSSGGNNVELCEFYETFEQQGNGAADLPRGVYNLDDLKKLGTARGCCPYFLARRVS